VANQPVAAFSGTRGGLSQGLPSGNVHLYGSYLANSCYSLDWWLYCSFVADSHWHSLARPPLDSPCLPPASLWLAFFILSAFATVSDVRSLATV